MATVTSWVSSGVEALSATATGRSLTGVIVIVAVVSAERRLPSVAL
jgi:hypothetical protein